MSMIGNYYALPPGELKELKDNPDKLEDAIFEAESFDENFFDVDKAWHGIHYLLTGSDWQGELPLFNAVLGGKEFGSEDLGYGPPRYLTKEEVQELNEALEKISWNELEKRYDPLTMSKLEIYPDIWDDEDALEYLEHHFNALKNFLADTARQEKALVLYLG